MNKIRNKSHIKLTLLVLIAVSPAHELQFTHENSIKCYITQ